MPTDALQASAPEPSPARAAAVDERAARLSQAVTGVLVLVSILSALPALLVFPALHLAASLALGPRGNLAIRGFDRFLAARLGAPRPEDPRPLRFANAVGAIFLAAALLLHAAGAVFAGNALAGIVAALALLAAATGFCLGCRLYWLVAAVRRAYRSAVS